MIAQARAATLSGIDALPVTVEVDIQGLPVKFILVGLPDKAVQESSERVYTAIRNSGLQLSLKEGGLQPCARRYQEGGTGSRPADCCRRPCPQTARLLREAVRTPSLSVSLGLDGKLRRVDGAVRVSLLMCHKIGRKETRAAQAERGRSRHR